MALMPLVAKVLIAGGPLTYGLLLGAFGVGAVGGRVRDRALAQGTVDRSDRALRQHRVRALPPRSRHSVRICSRRWPC